ncbi:hypothetical protein C2G38_2043316 [Gigaspora rosea]|uniref:Uncharacterized protein n=1 Tax=Gigaspora rosea TaxID=44941 RepID=A0A397UK47_9GLOM|nr:hypothetical protein C2G38_2043316 [Gigaspora rosea]
MQINSQEAANRQIFAPMGWVIADNKENERPPTDIIYENLVKISENDDGDSDVELATPNITHQDTTIHKLLQNINLLFAKQQENINFEKVLALLDPLLDAD